MSSRTAFVISLIAGLVLLGLTAFSVTLPPVAVCGDLAKNYPTIIAFELVRSVTDLHAIFGDHAGACRTAIAARLDYIDQVDNFAYIPSYGAFLFFFFWGMRARRKALATYSALLVLVICLADYVENYSLFQLSADPDRADWVRLLLPATETKWIGIGIAGALGAVLLWRGTLLSWLIALLCGVGLIASLVSLPAPAVVGPYLSNAIALGWLVFLFVDFRETIRPSISRAGS